LSDDGFAEFYQRTFAQVLSATIMASGHRGDAEDAVQEAYIIALRRWALVGGYDAPEAWVLKVALRRLWRSQRRRRHGEQLAVTVPPDATPEETAYAREVLGALATLPPPVRIAMVMCAVLGWTQAEVAEVLQVPRNTIANRIFRGRAKLAAQLGMTGQVTGVRDPLVPSQGPVARFAVLEEDPVGESLARAESWLRAGIEAEPDAAGRIWALVMESASVPEEGRGQREPWRLVRRLAPGRHNRDLDG
jgi:RNA polymerase sigma factor (sigma-70 family)